jgi:hypothetical protein
MLVRLTVAKRFLKDNFLYRKARIYNVPEAMGLNLCGMMDKDMPMFGIIDPANVGEIPVVNLQIEDEVPEVPVKPQTVVEATTSPKKAKTVSEKSAVKPKAKAKAKPKLKKPKAKAATEKSGNVVQV